MSSAGPGGPTDAPVSKDSVHLVHIGRQPIYDRDNVVVGYELLFRSAADESSASRRGTYATSQVILNAFTEFGLEQIVGDRTCFINLTRDFLVGDLPLPFEPGQAVLEVLETVEVDEEVVAGVTHLVEQGYPIALDDYVFGLGHERLLGLATYLKLDMLIREPAEIAEAVARCRQFPNLKLVAERVETDGHVELACRLGFDLFQGFALGRTQVMSTTALSPSRMRRLELLGALTAEDVSVGRIVEIVTNDPSLSFRILRATNSASAGVTRKVSSVRDAVVMLGSAKIRQWVALMLVSDIAASASEEQIGATMARAKLCQTVAERLELSGDAGFTVGLLSGVSSLIAEPIAAIVAHLPLTRDVTEALVGGQGRLGEVLAMVKAYEATDVGMLRGAALSSGELARAYLGALGWSRRTVDGALGGSGPRRIPPAAALKRPMPRH